MEPTRSFARRHPVVASVAAGFGLLAVLAVAALIDAAVGGSVSWTVVVMFGVVFGLLTAFNVWRLLRSTAHKPVR
jgi:hypothetical protein